MTSAIRSITFDCTDPWKLAEFWAAVTGYDFKGVNEEGALAVNPRGEPRLLFLRVPEGKAVKNRVHLDLRPNDTMDAEVARLVGLGATKLRLVEEEEGDFTVMQDPEGNEFCVEQGPGDK